MYQGVSEQVMYAVKNVFLSCTKYFSSSCFEDTPRGGEEYSERGPELWYPVQNFL